MKYQRKAAIVDAFRFTGTTLSVQDAKDWLSSQDVLNVEVGYQGELSDNCALDLISDGDLSVIEPGTWLIVRSGKVYAESSAYFEENYEPVAIV